MVSAAGALLHGDRHPTPWEGRAVLAVSHALFLVSSLSLWHAHCTLSLPPRTRLQAPLRHSKRLHTPLHVFLAPALFCSSLPIGARCCCSAAGAVGTGRKHVTGTAELRFPLFKPIEGTLFVDGGSGAAGQGEGGGKRGCQRRQSGSRRRGKGRGAFTVGGHHSTYEGLDLLRASPPAQRSQARHAGA